MLMPDAIRETAWIENSSFLKEWWRDAWVIKKLL
jgi:hypothetical protein